MEALKAPTCQLVSPGAAAGCQTSSLFTLTHRLTKSVRLCPNLVSDGGVFLTEAVSVVPG